MLSSRVSVHPDRRSSLSNLLWTAWWVWAVAIQALAAYALLRPGFRF
jgi:hypothetical protein